MMLDDEARADRLLDALDVVQAMLVQLPACGEVKVEHLGQLLSLLADEARAVVVPFRLAATDAGCG